MVCCLTALDHYRYNLYKSWRISIGPIGINVTTSNQNAIILLKECISKYLQHVGKCIQLPSCLTTFFLFNIYIKLPCTYHSSDVIMSTMVYQITGVTIVHSTFCSGADQRKHQSPARRTSIAVNVSIWWRHHVRRLYTKSIAWVESILHKSLTL